MPSPRLRGDWLHGHDIKKFIRRARRTRDDSEAGLSRRCVFEVAETLYFPPPGGGADG